MYAENIMPIFCTNYLVTSPINDISSILMKSTQKICLPDMRREFTIQSPRVNRHMASHWCSARTSHHWNTPRLPYVSHRPASHRADICSLL